MKCLLGQYETICIFCQEVLPYKQKNEVIVCPHCGKKTVVAQAVEKGVRR